MSKVGAVAWREFKHTAMTRAFILGAVAFPLFAWVSFPVIIWLTTQDVPVLRGTVAVIDESGEVLRAAEIVFDPERLAAESADRAGQTARIAEDIRSDPGGAVKRLKAEPEAAAELASAPIPIEITLEAALRDDLAALKARVRDGELLAVLTVDERVLDIDALPRTMAERRADDAPRLELSIARELRPDHTRLLRRRFGDAVVRARAERLGNDVEFLEAVVRPPRVEEQVLIKDGAEEAGSDLRNALPYGFMMLLTICAFTGGQYLLTSTIEEKSNRVMEVLLSAVSPMELMTGKILGQGLVGLVTLFMYGALAIAGLIVFATLSLVTPLQWICFGLYFPIAYLFTAAVMASIGSAVQDMHDAQSLMFPAVMLLLFLPMMLMFPAQQNPDGALAVVAGFVPPFIPYVMMVRVMSSEVPIWQIALSMVLGVGGVVAALWGAARIFRVGVLMYGKPPTPLEVLKWVRMR